MPARNPAVIIATPLFPPPQEAVPRRTLFRAAFGLGLAAATVTAVGAALQFAWPRNTRGFGGVFTVPAEQLPEPGAEPVMFVQAQAFIVNLLPGEGSFGGFGASDGAGGVLAL